MRVRDLLEGLQQMDPDAIVVGLAGGMSGYTEQNVIIQDVIGGLDQRYSFEPATCVILGHYADEEWAKKQHPGCVVYFGGLVPYTPPTREEMHALLEVDRGKE